MELKVLAFAPHADDEVIGCGGSLAKHASQGAAVTVAIVVQRERSSSDEQRSDAELLAEADLAAHRLGVGHVRQLNYPSRDDWPTRELVSDLVGVVRQVAPQVVYMPHAGESDLEHAAVNRLARESLWLAVSPYLSERGKPVAMPALVLGYEVWTPIVEVTYIEDVTDFIDKKAYALEAYQSQLDVKRFDAAIRGLSAYRGVMSGECDYAEAFTIHRLSPSIVNSRTKA